MPSWKINMREIEENKWLKRQEIQKVGKETRREKKSGKKQRKIQRSTEKY